MARGRMISKSLSISDKWASLDKLDAKRADFCRVLFVLMVTHADDHGRLPGDAGTVKRLVVPYSGRPETQVEAALGVLAASGLIVWYQVDGHKYVQVQQFANHQYLKGHDSRPSAFPAPDELSCPLLPKVALTKPNLTEPNLSTNAAPKEPDPRVKVFIDWFCAKYAELRNGAKYLVKGAKDGALVKALLQAHDIERLKQHAVILLTTNEEWTEGTDRGIGILSARINWLEERLAAWEAKQRKARAV